MKDRLRSNECARALKALADPDRLKLLQCLQEGPKNVTQLAGLLDCDIAKASHHLQILRQAGLVRDRKEGKFVVYSLEPSVVHPDESGEGPDVVDLGCCRLHLGP